MEFPVEEVGGLVKLLLRKAILQANDAVFHQIGLGNDHHQHAAVRKIDKLDVLQQLFFQRRGQHQAHVV